MRRRTCAAGAALVLVGIVATVALWAPAAGAAGGEGPVTGKVEEIPPLEFEFGVSPKMLPVGRGAVTRLSLGYEVARPANGEVPPGITKMTIGLDRSIMLEPQGLPVCHKLGLEAGPQIAPTRFHECAGAVVGHVQAEVLYNYPTDIPTLVHGKGTVYSGGGDGGSINLVLEIEAGFDKTVWLLAKVRPARDGRIGSELTIAVPTIAEGSVTLTGLHLELGRNFVRDGERVGYVQASCDGRKLTASDATRLTDGTETHSESTRACTKRHG